MKIFLIGFFSPLLITLLWEAFLQITNETKIEIAKNIKGVPAVGTQYLIVDKKSYQLIPLGGISKKKTYLCNEGNGKTIYQADLYGFPNPIGSWEKKVDFAFLGDSYFQGACVKKGSSFIDRLRSQKNIINLSSFGHGPLSQLGLILEYLPRIKPKKVFLSYVPNDLGIDLHLEYRNSKLRSYLHGQTQNLIERQDEIDSLYEIFLLTFGEPKNPHKSFKIIDLYRQKKLAFDRSSPSHSGYPTDYQRPHILPWQIYQEVLFKAQEVVSSWGGELIMVLIPDAAYFSKKDRDFAKKHFLQLKGFLESVGIKNIDFSHMFSPSENPFQFYSPLYGYYGHFNELGQEKAFRYLQRKLKEIE